MKSSDFSIPDGLWPTMLTPFTKDKRIDYKALEELIRWYIQGGVNGLFAVCQSSEMFFLSLRERVALARFVKENTGGLPVIASGHVSDSLDEQVDEIGSIWATGIDAFVLVSNRLAAADESDEKVKESLSYLLERLPEVRFGMYECPYPYKRLMTPELLDWCAKTGRFYFLKDTSCDLEQIKGRCDAVRGTQLKIFNANSATLLESLKLGVAGFSGVMANYHPQLYRQLLDSWKTDPAQALKLSDYLGFSSLIEMQYYPVSAKYYLRLAGLPFTLQTRAKGEAGFRGDMRLQTEQLYRNDLAKLREMKRTGGEGQ